MIVIYGTPQCGFCHDSVALAKKYGLKYEYRDITYSKNYRLLRSENVDMQKIPHIWWDDKYIGDYGDFFKEIQSHYIMKEFGFADAT